MVRGIRRGRRHQRKHAKRPGLAPGTLVHTGEPRQENVRITVLDYDADHVAETRLEAVEQCAKFERTPTVTWINVDGVHDTGVLARIGEQFKLHPLVVEDLTSVRQRPKMEAYDDYLFLVMRQLLWDQTNAQVQHEQFSIVLGRRWVLSFQESEGDVLDPVRERLRSGKGRIRKMGPDYLAYALMDAIVDHYFIILEKLGERIQDMEDSLILEPRQELLQDIHAMRQEALFLRKSVWPLREVLSQIVRDESPLVSAECRVYFRDVYDHTIQVVDTLESYREMIAGMLEIYLSSVSHRLNEVMKVLTIVSTIFIPLSFIVGLYGMNFEHMPELHWRWGYPLVLMFMLGVGLGMLAYFRHRKWL